MVLRFPVLAGAELLVVVRLLCNDTGCSGFSVFLFTGILIILLVRVGEFVEDLCVLLVTVGFSFLALLDAVFCVDVLRVILSADVLVVFPVLIPSRDADLRPSLAILPDAVLFAAVSPAVANLERRTPVENPASLSARLPVLNPTSYPLS